MLDLVSLPLLIRFYSRIRPFYLLCASFNARFSVMNGISPLQNVQLRNSWQHGSFYGSCLWPGHLLSRSYFCFLRTNMAQI